MALLFCALAWPSSAFAVGPNAIMRPSGYNANGITRGDDNTISVVNLPFSMNWFGTTYNQIYINQNGNCTFRSNFTGYAPTSPLSSQARDIMAPFWADVDTSVGGQSTYSNIVTPPQVNGRNAFFVNWENVGYYNAHATPSNYFQLVIVDRADTGAGNFDFYFNYDQVLWDTGDTYSAPYHARAGWARRTGGTSYELPGSGSTTSSALMDSGSAATSLIQNCQDPNGQLGRYVWQVRNGVAPNQPPKVVVTNRVIEGNTTNAFGKYTGSGDVTATDSDGTIASLTSVPSLPATLPLGTTNIVWTATDNRGATDTAVQSVTVTDTTPPANPTLSSPTSTVGVWSTNPTVTVAWSGATDVCTGVNGYSYSWSQNAAAVPDTTKDAAASTVTTSVADGVWYFNLRTVDSAGNWSSVVSRGPFKVDRGAPTTTDNAPPGWSNAPVTVSLTATDLVGGVAVTRYRLDGGATTTYTAPVTVSTEGTHTMQYWSVDNGGNTEATKTATIRVDLNPPTVPTGLTASAVSTTSVQLSWSPSTDTISAVTYRIYRDGSLVATSSSPTYTDTGRTPGQTYAYQVVAGDAAGNTSAASGTATVQLPSTPISISVSANTIAFNGVVPGVTSSIASATVVKVTGVGGNGYDLSCVASDFTNLNGASATPTMPVGALACSGRGWVIFPSQPMTTAGRLLDSSPGTPFVWRHDYIMDMTLDAPWTNEAGTYQTSVVFTMVAK